MDYTCTIEHGVIRLFKYYIVGMPAATSTTILQRQFHVKYNLSTTSGSRLLVVLYLGIEPYLQVNSTYEKIHWHGLEAALSMQYPFICQSSSSSSTGINQTLLGFIFELVE